MEILNGYSRLQMPGIFRDDTQTQLLRELWGIMSTGNHDLLENCGRAAGSGEISQEGVLGGGGHPSLN